MRKKAVPEHGTRRCYQRGCTQVECREANAAYKRDRQAVNKARTQAATEAYRQAGGQGGIPSLDHGKPHTYYWYGCRCVDCKEVVNRKQAMYKRIRRVVQLAQAI